MPRGNFWPRGSGDRGVIYERLDSRLYSQSRPLSHRGLLGTVGMAGVLGRSGKGRRFQLREGKGLNCGVTPKDSQGAVLAVLLASLTSLPRAT